MLYPNQNTKLNVDKSYSPSRGNRGYLVQIGLTFIVALSLLLAIFSILLQQPAIVLAAGETCFATIAPSVTTTYSSTNATALRNAVAAANPGDTVKVAGTCAGTDASGGQVVNLTKTLTIRGAYTTTNWSSPQPSVYTTTLDAMQDGRVINIKDADILLENLTITGGQISGDGGGLYIRNYDNTVTISNSIISHNTAITTSLYVNGNGGGLYNQGSSTSSKVILINTLIHSNTASSSGGGLYNSQVVSMIVMTNSTISYNTAQFGGGITNNTNGQVMMDNSSISNNTASSSGGGIGNADSTMTMVDTLISHNVATWGGGGIHNESNSQLAMVNTTINSNTTQSLIGGGIYNSNESQVVMTNSTISHNTAPSGGGGIANVHANTVVTMTNSTVSYNGGSMIYNSGSISVRNSIIAHSLSGDNCFNDGGTINSTGYNLSNDASCNFTSIGDQQNSNPLLGSLAANGGSTAGVNGEQPMLTHALLSGSPAIDSGYCDLSTDQRGEARPGSFTSACDIGAYEAQEVTADVGLSKSVTPITANVGDTITYTLTFSNSGDVLAQNVIITDAVPMEITNIILSSSGATITPTAGITFAWTVEDLSAGESGTITLIGQVDPALILDTTVTNTAIITTSTVEASSANNIAQAALDIRPRPVLHLEKSAFPAAPVAGEQMTYTIQISNSSNIPATGVIISDGVPAETTYVPGSITGVGGNATGDPNLMWSAGTVSFGNPITVTFAVTVNSNVVSGTQVINTAAVSSSEVMTQVMGSAVVTVNQNADLSISKSSQREGGIITYTLVISNAGPSAVSGATVSDTIPAGIETASWIWQCDSSGGASCSAGPFNSNIADTVNLPVGGQLIYTVTATLTDSTSTVTNTATVTAPASVIELTPANNAAVDVTVNNRWFIYLPVILKN